LAEGTARYLPLLSISGDTPVVRHSLALPRNAGFSQERAAKKAKALRILFYFTFFPFLSKIMEGCNRIQVCRKKGPLGLHSAFSHPACDFQATSDVVKFEGEIKTSHPGEGEKYDLNYFFRNDKFKNYEGIFYFGNQFWRKRPIERSANGNRGGRWACGRGRAPSADSCAPFGVCFLDTGAMYRAVAVERSGRNQPDDESALEGSAKL